MKVLKACITLLYYSATSTDAFSLPSDDSTKKMMAFHRLSATMTKTARFSSILNDDKETTSGTQRGEEWQKIPIPGSGPLPGPESMKMDLPAFKEYLRQEADIQISVLGPAWKDYVEKERSFRLSLHENWLKSKAVAESDTGNAPDVVNNDFLLKQKQLLKQEQQKMRSELEVSEYGKEVVKSFEQLDSLAESFQEVSSSWIKGDVVQSEEAKMTVKEPKRDTTASSWVVKPFFADIRETKTTTTTSSTTLDVMEDIESTAEKGSFANLELAMEAQVLLKAEAAAEAAAAAAAKAEKEAELKSIVEVEEVTEVKGIEKVQETMDIEDAEENILKSLEDVIKDAEEAVLEAEAALSKISEDLPSPSFGADYLAALSNTESVPISGTSSGTGPSSYLGSLEGKHSISMNVGKGFESYQDKLSRIVKDVESLAEAQVVSTDQAEVVKGQVHVPAAEVDKVVEDDTSKAVPTALELTEIDAGTNTIDPKEDIVSDIFSAPSSTVSTGFEPEPEPESKPSGLFDTLNSQLTGRFDLLRSEINNALYNSNSSKEMNYNKKTKTTSKVDDKVKSNAKKELKLPVIEPPAVSSASSVPVVEPPASPLPLPVLSKDLSTGISSTSTSTTSTSTFRFGIKKPSSDGASDKMIITTPTTDPNAGDIDSNSISVGVTAPTIKTITKSSSLQRYHVGGKTMITSTSSITTSTTTNEMNVQSE